MVEAKLRKCHPAKIKIAKHWLYNTEIVLLIKSMVWLIRLIYLQVYVAPRIIILNYTLSLQQNKFSKIYRSYWYCFLNNFCCFESKEIRHIQWKYYYCYAKFYFFLYLFPHVCSGGGGGGDSGGGGGVVLITQYFIQSPKLDILHHYWRVLSTCISACTWLRKK